MNLFTDMPDTSRRTAAQGIPPNTIARLSLYRRLLLELAASGAGQVYSHQLAALAVSTSAQVRRDLMTIGFSGSPRRGYDTQDLVAAINVVLARSVETSVALVGVGNLGRAILSYYATRQPWVRFAAAFDREPDPRPGHPRLPRPPHGTARGRARTRGHPRRGHRGPGAGSPAVADRLVLAGIKSLLNFAPVRLHVPTGTFIDNMDMSTALDRVAYYAHPHGKSSSRESAT